MRVVGFLGVMAAAGWAAPGWAVCPAAPVSSAQDTVIRLKASGGVAGIGPAGNMVSNTQGALVFDTGANTVKFCDGTSWVELGGGGGGASIPAGAVMAFDLTSCPSGWTEYTVARGRFLRGIDNGAGNDPDGTRTPGHVQADELRSHLHSVDPPSTATSSGGAHTHTIVGGTGTSAGTSRLRIQGSSGSGNMATESAGAHTHTVNIPAFNSAATGEAETRPKNVAVLFCRKT